MNSPMINIEGTNADTVKEVRDAIIAILTCNAGWNSNGLKVVALNALKDLCRNSIAITNCRFTNIEKEDAEAPDNS